MMSYNTRNAPLLVDNTDSVQPGSFVSNFPARRPDGGLLSNAEIFTCFFQNVSSQILIWLYIAESRVCFEVDKNKIVSRQ